MLKKIILFFTILIILFSNKSFATNEIDVSDFIDEVKEYSNDIFPELADENWLNNILSRRN